MTDACGIDRKVHLGKVNRNIKITLIEKQIPYQRGGNGLKMLLALVLIKKNSLIRNAKGRTGKHLSTVIICFKTYFTYRQVRIERSNLIDQHFNHITDALYYLILFVFHIGNTIL